MSDRRAPLIRLAAVTAALWAIGGALGLAWQWWSPAGPAGYQLAPGVIQPDETEAFVAGDGRFATIALAVGILAGLVVWFARIGRGVLTVFALAAGGLGGSAAMAAVGRAVRGTGRYYSCGAGRCIDHLPLTVHAHGLLLVEAAAAVLVYGLCVSFARSDDLGRPDPTRELARSVGADVELQHAGRDRDGPGGPQQGDLAPQE